MPGNPLEIQESRIVFEAVRDGKLGALKLLTRKGDKARARFVSEIEAMRQCLDIDGVLPLLDAVVFREPAYPGELWLVTQVATPLSSVREEPRTLDEIVKIIAAVSRTLAEMHSRGFSHRDIKPENLFLLNDKPYVGDFGLVSFPGKRDLTEVHERIGPMFYLAPEMLTFANTADGKPADVFSLAKTLWALAVGLKFPVPGQLLSRYEVFALQTYVPHPRARQLHSLLEIATHADPVQRPQMLKFAEALAGWLIFKSPAPTSSSIGLVNQELLKRIDDSELLQADRLAVDEASRAVDAAIRAQWIPILEQETAKIEQRLKDSGLNFYVSKQPSEWSCSAELQTRMQYKTNFAAVFKVELYFSVSDGARCWSGISIEQQFDNEMPPAKVYTEHQFLHNSAEEDLAISKIAENFESLFRVEFRCFVDKVSSS